MKSWKHIFLMAVVAITIMSLLLSACGPIDNSNGNSNKENNKDKDKDNKNDSDDENSASGKITICHRTGSAKNPYVEIKVSVNATTDGHGAHEGDLIPAPEGGCPATVTDTEANGSTANKITICHKTGSAKNPYAEITVSMDATTDGHGTHEGDLIPAPEGGCPSSVAAPDMPAK